MLPLSSVVDYQAEVDRLGVHQTTRTSKFLDRLSDAWVSTYKLQSGRKTNITEMWFNGFSALVDLEGSDHCDGRGPQPPGVFPRTLVAYGLSSPTGEPRKSEDGRLRALMPTAPDMQGGRDKGHFIAHSIGGVVVAAETNVFSQRRNLNRGWSEAGKVFRRLERYAVENPGTPYFHRAIYLLESDVPDFLEVGLVTTDYKLWVEVFDNRDAA